jgi:hypothetical protein
MVRSIEGIYREGRVELLEPAPSVTEAKVIVTFLQSPSAVDLAKRGVDAEQAADLRARLSAFEEDWSRPEMDAYDAL